MATEVRNLAHRSAEAAKNIRGLIDVTHQNVQQGATVVGETEKNMQEIVQGAGQLSQLMQEISTTTAEQEKGINQITQAMNELEKVTQSNALMVDELSGSSDVLKSQVVDLQSKTHQFRLSDSTEEISTSAHKRYARGFS